MQEWLTFVMVLKAVGLLDCAQLALMWWLNLRLEQLEDERNT